MTAERDELAKALSDAVPHHTAGNPDDPDGWFKVYADALLASDAIARIVAEARAEAGCELQRTGDGSHGPLIRQAKAEALREAANAWTRGAWADVMLPKPAPPAVPVIAYSNGMGDWLRDRADDVARGGEPS